MQDKNFIRFIFRNGPSDLLIRKPAALLYDNGVNRIIFLSTPITTGNIFSKKKLLTRLFRISSRYLFLPNTLFLFCSRSSTKIKGLLWEGDGFLLLYKRVESGHFAWPHSSAELRSLSAEQFHWLMQGFSIDPVIHDITPSSSI